MLWTRRPQPTATVPELDTSVPALLLKLGRYPLHHGGVGVIRSLGRCGVDVHAITESALTPAAVSRYRGRRFSLPATGTEDPTELRDDLLEIGRRIGRPAVLVPTDDEAAVAVAELDRSLGAHFLVPHLERPAVARELASKQGMHDLCVAHDVPTAGAAFPDSLAEVDAYADAGRFPVVVKNRDAGERRRHPAVRASTVVETSEDLRELAAGWADPPNVILQEHIPASRAEDWIAHMSIGGDDDADDRVFTGVKIRSWPPRAGMTSCAYATWHAELAETSRRFARTVGFHGIADLDWRYDQRDGRFKLLDFNPRVGAQFRMFEDGAGIDVVRAQHLALTGRGVPVGAFPENRRFVVEDFDLRARRVYTGDADLPGAPSATERAWLAGDDPLPVLPLVYGRAVSMLGKAGRAAFRKREPGHRDH